jgi:hypothetical protein
MRIDDALEITMDVVERGTYSLIKANKTWNIIFNSFSNHLNGKTRCRIMGAKGVFTTKEDVKVIKWTLVMQECGLSIYLH